jgi:hypothetical protein
MKPHLLITYIMLLSIASNAQNSNFEFSVNEAQDYAILHNTEVKNAKLDVTSAEKKYGKPQQ